MLPLANKSNGLTTRFLANLKHSSDQANGPITAKDLAQRESMILLAVALCNDCPTDCTGVNNYTAQQ